MADPKKGSLMIALLGASKKAKAGDDGDDDAPESSDDVSSDDKGDYAGETAAAADIRQALDDKDDEALAQALCDLIDIHTSKGK